MPDSTYKQIIIVRKDLHMSPGKLAAQVSHASMAFLTTMIRENTVRILTCQKGHVWSLTSNGAVIPQYYMHPVLQSLRDKAAAEGKTEFFYRIDEHGNPVECASAYKYRSVLCFDAGVYENWIKGTFTKTILEAKNRNQLLKAKAKAEELGMQEGKDFFLIRDNCYTELQPEEEDGRTLTCIGFAPMKSDSIDVIGKKYQLYRD